MIRKTKIFILCMLLTGLLILFLIPIILANNVWINYGQEAIGVFTMLETLTNSGIGLDITGESMPSSGSAPSSSGGSGGGGGSSVTNVYNTYVMGGEENEKSSEADKKEQEETEVSKEEVSGSSWITGSVIGTNLLSGGQIIAIVAIVAGIFVVFIIVTSRTIIRLKKK